MNSILFSISAITGVGKSPALTETGLQLMERPQFHQPTWYFIYLFILLGLYAWISIYYGNVLTQSFLASTNFKLTNRMFKNNSLLQNQLDGALYLFYFLSMTLLLYITELKTGLLPYELQGVLLFLFNLGLLAMLFFGRIILHNIVGFLFNRVRIVREYLYNMFVFNKLSGIVVVPLLFLMIYTRGTLQEIAFWTCISVLSGILVLRLIRAVVFSYRKDVLNFYMFLYLCALEIMPLVLLYRWLEGIL